MPIVWRYLLGQYLKVMFFCTLAFIAVLLTTRLDDIAHFATLGAEGYYLLLFTLHQIPYVLPIAIPISGLISAIILIQRLSQTHELTALRASGMAVRHILAPILIAASFLSVANFFIVSEIATHSHLTTGLLKNELRSVNPLLLLHNKHLMRLKGFYFDSMGPSRLGESASEVIIALPNKHNNRMNVMLAKNLESSPVEFTGTGVTLISNLQASEETGFDPLVIENMGQSTTSIADFSQMIQKKVWTIHEDYLQLPLLLARLDEENHALAMADPDMPKEDRKEIVCNISRCHSEIVRRISVALAAFTFTFMGAAFGISITRSRSQRGVVFVICLAAMYLISYFVAKALEQNFLASSLLYLAPHVIIVLLAIWTLRNVSKGIE